MNGELALTPAQSTSHWKRWTAALLILATVLLAFGLADPGGAPGVTVANQSNSAFGIGAWLVLAGEALDLASIIPARRLGWWLVLYVPASYVGVNVVSLIVSVAVALGTR